MAYLNGGVYPESIEEYTSLRSLIFQNMDDIDKDMCDMIGSNFINSLRLGVCGKFVYLKKYQKGHVLQYIDTGQYYQVKALTTPIDEFIGEYSVINTAVIPYANQLVCDGLIHSHGVSIGKNMAKEIRDGYWQAKRSGKLVTGVS